MTNKMDLFVEWPLWVASAPLGHSRHGGEGGAGGAGVEGRWEGSLIAHVALLCCFLGPESPAVNYSFSVLIITSCL